MPESLSVTVTREAPEAIGPYSQAISVGDLIFCSGQIPLDPASGEMVDGAIDVQTEQVLANLEAVLVAAGSSMERVVRTTVYLVDLGDFAAMNRVYERAFGGHRPARVTVEVQGLPKNASLEIDCIAVGR